MFRTIMIISTAGILAATTASADDPLPKGRKLDAIASGRLYDRLLTPQLNPGYDFDYRAEQQFMNDLREGAIDLNAVPEPRRSYFDFQLQIDN
jgi:hypothetical protein